MRKPNIKTWWRRWRWWLAALLALGAVAVVTWRYWPSSERTVSRSAAIVESRSWYELCAGERPVVYFNHLEGDTLMGGPALRRDSAWQVSRTAACWLHRWAAIPSCRGRLVTANSDTVQGPLPDARQLLRHERQALRRQLAALRKARDEMGYYLRVHGIQDEGFPIIADHAEETAARLDLLTRVSQRLDSLGDTTRLTLRRKTEYMVYYRNLRGQLTTRPCRRLATTGDGKAALLQTDLRLTPIGVHAQVVVPWSAEAEGEVVATGHGGLAEPSMSALKTRPVLVPGRLKDGRLDLPRILVADGEPVFSARGRFLGICVGGRLVDRTALSALFGKQPSQTATAKRQEK